MCVCAGMLNSEWVLCLGMHLFVFILHCYMYVPMSLRIREYATNYYLVSSNFIILHYILYVFKYAYRSTCALEGVFEQLKVVVSFQKNLNEESVV